jgi:molybdopterin molybdotransferase
MSEFFNVLPPEDAKRLLIDHVLHRTGNELISTYKSLDRILSTAVSSPQDLPSFRRSTMDGYAVKASETYGAAETLPAILNVVGEVTMGSTAGITLLDGEAAMIHTGGMVPPDADAVVQIEDTQFVTSTVDAHLPFEIEVFRPVAVGQNMIQVGEDVLKGTEILPAGHRLRAQDIGGLLAVGLMETEVSQRPKVAIIATGDEIVPPDHTLREGQIRDINSFTIGALVEKNGGVPKYGGILRDEYRTLFDGAATALEDSDMLVISAGSSVSVRDLTFQVIDDLGEPGVLLHGVATRPGKPTVLGVVSGKPILGLPGNPVSAFIQFLVLGIPALYRLQGSEKGAVTGIVQASISHNVPSASGREDFVPVRLTQTTDGLVAEPVFGKSNLIYTLVNAGGLLKIPINRSGYQAGETGEVLLF